MNYALILPIVFIVIGILSYLEILYFPYAVILIMMLYVSLLAWLNYGSGPDFPEKWVNL